MDPSIGRIVDDISGLTLLQAADLVSLLKVSNEFLDETRAFPLTFLGGITVSAKYPRDCHAIRCYACVSDWCRTRRRSRRRGETWALIHTRGANSHLLQEKPKEKTIFNVMLKSFDAAAKPKVIREVKALVPNLTLIDVGARRCDLELILILSLRRKSSSSPSQKSSRRISRKRTQTN